MAKQVVWTKKVLETFLEESGINDRIKMGDEHAMFLEKVMRTRYAGWKQHRQAADIPGATIDTVKKAVRELKDLYDETEKNSIILSKRTNYTRWEKKKNRKK
mgnify:CR=1 FL=1